MRISDWSSDVCSSDLEAVAFEQGGTFFTTFANAPEATLVGGEIEVQKYVPLADFVGGDFFAARRLVLIGNYTFTDSDIKVGPNDTTIPIGSEIGRASCRERVCQYV